MNLVEASIEGDELRFGGLAIPLDETARPADDATARRRASGRRRSRTRAFAPPELPRLDVDVEVVEELGADTHVFFRVDAPRVSRPMAAVAADDDATLLAEERTLFTARVDPRTRIRAGERALLAVDPARFHFFDPGNRAQPLTSAAPARPRRCISHDWS